MYDGWPLWLPVVDVEAIIMGLHCAWPLLMQDIANIKHGMVFSCSSTNDPNNTLPLPLLLTSINFNTSMDK